MSAPTLPPAPMLMLPMTVDQLSALIDERLARHAERQEMARHPWDRDQCAEVYAGKSLARWRSLRHDYPVIDERASVGTGRQRRWHPDKLAEVMAELKPSLRRQRRQAAE